MNDEGVKAGRNNISIEDRLLRLQEEIRKAGDLTERLIGRIDPILRPSEPHPNSDAKVVAPAPISRMANHIQEIEYLAHALQRMVNDAHERLEISFDLQTL